MMWQRLMLRLMLRQMRGIRLGTMLMLWWRRNMLGSQVMLMLMRRWRMLSRDVMLMLRRQRKVMLLRM